MQLGKHKLKRAPRCRGGVKSVTKPRDGRWKPTQPRVENPRTGAPLPEERRVLDSDAGLPEAPGCRNGGESGGELRYFLLVH